MERKRREVLRDPGLRVARFAEDRCRLWVLVALMEVVWE